MNVTHDAATDTLTIVLRPDPVRESIEERSGVILDYDASDRLVAIEVLEASIRVGACDSVRLKVTAKQAEQKAAE